MAGGGGSCATLVAGTHLAGVSSGSLLDEDGVMSLEKRLMDI